MPLRQRVAYANTKSDVIAKREGIEVEKRPAHPKKGLVAVKLEKKAPKHPNPTPVVVTTPVVPQDNAAAAAAYAMQAAQGYMPYMPQVRGPWKWWGGSGRGENHACMSLEKTDPAGWSAEGGAFPSCGTCGFQGGTNGLGPALPHNILFAKNLPEDAVEEMLVTLFQQYPGLKEVSAAALPRHIDLNELSRLGPAACLILVGTADWGQGTSP